MKVSRGLPHLTELTLRVYVVDGDSDPYRVSARELSRKGGFDFRSIMGFLWNRIRHNNGSLGTNVIIPLGKNVRRPKQDRLLSMRQLRDLIPDLLPRRKASVLLAEVERNIQYCRGRSPAVPVGEGDRVRADIISYLSTGEESQARLARKLGCSDATLSLWLRGLYPGRGTKIERRIIEAAPEVLKAGMH